MTDSENTDKEPVAGYYCSKCREWNTTTVCWNCGHEVEGA